MQPTMKCIPGVRMGSRGGVVITKMRLAHGALNYRLTMAVRHPNENFNYMERKRL